MKIQVYTSCSINYLPKARVLAQSLKRRTPNSRITLLLNDRYTGLIDTDNEPFDEVLTPLDMGYSKGWIFQHNVMELCTAVKGRFLFESMEKGEADFYAYLDPDCYVFNDLTIVSDYLGEASIGLVPHILRPETTDIGVELTEISVAEHGTYNFGHLFVRPDKNGKAFADWWMRRLDKFCFDDKERGLFTDQRWGDMVPALFDGVKVLRVPNLDVASWNLAGRTIAQKHKDDETSFSVDGYPLVTYHFSGTGPSGTHFRIRNIFDAGNGAVAEIERIYEEAIQRCGQSTFEHIEFSWGFFEDNTLVPATARKLYRKHADLQETFPDPYEISGTKLSYKSWLKSNRPGVVDGLVVERGRLREAFEALFDSEYYLSTYPEVKEQCVRGAFDDAMHHYITVGSRLFYNPNKYFNSNYYYRGARYIEGYSLSDRSGDAAGTLLWHYLTVGITNGVEPVPYFNSAYYLRVHPDVYRAFINGNILVPLQHYMQYGDKEARLTCEEFNGVNYLQQNTQAAKMVAGGQALGPIDAFIQLNPYWGYDF